MIVDVENLGGVGVVSDISPYKLPPNAVTLAKNVRFEDGGIVAAPNHHTMASTVGTTPFFLYRHPNVSSTVYTRFSYATGSTIHTFEVQRVGNDRQITEFENTRVGGYNTSQSGSWTGTTLGSLTYFTNGVDPVQKFTSNAMAGQCADLINWQPTWKTFTIRSFRNRLLALGVSESGVYNGLKILFSSIATDPEAEPSTWLGTGSGEIILSDADGYIVDGLSLGTSFIIYTTGGAHRMDHVGGQSIFAINPVPNSPGMLSTHCGQLIKGQHIIVTQDDVMAFNGVSSASIVNERVKNEIFSKIDVDSRLVHTLHNSPDNEFWVINPGAGITSIWNYETNTWTYDDADYYMAVVGSWDSGIFSGFNPVKSVVGLMDSGEVRSLTREYSSLLPSYSTGTVERTGLFFGAAHKKLSTVYPLIESDNGQMVFQFGSEEYPGAGYVWDDPLTYDVDDQKIDLRLSGQSFSWKATFDENFRQKLIGFKFEFEEAGTSRR